MLAERVKEWNREATEKGLQQGMQQGMQKGLQKGTQQVLSRQLEIKFGPLSFELETKLEQASEEELLKWSERILNAETPGDIFGH